MRERESSQAGENEGTGKEGEELGLCPNHPNVKVIPSQTLSNRILYFQEKWFKDHTWLHYSPSVKGVLCFYCAKYFAAQKSKLASKADSAFVKTVRDSMGLVHELGGFFNQSGKFKLIFQNIVKSEHGSTFTSLKPLCPTRWTVRTPAIRSVLKQYESVLMALEEMASCSSPETSAKANGLHGTFLKGNTVRGLLMAEDLMGGFGQLLWQQSWTYNQFRCLMSANLQSVAPVCSPYHPDSQSLYRIQFYNALDTVNAQFIERFEQAGFHKLQQLENVLLHGDMDKVVEEYPELNSRLLQVQLAIFGANYTYETSSDVASIIQEMVPEVRGLFGQVEALVRLLLVPASSAEIERSFSALRRLKTWLRSSMSQTRLNNVAICHVHQKKLDRLDLEGICQSFISANDKLKKAFGSFA
ncbi:hypothetical protein F7725_025240 [Dissostichus mawsoni]|uniref:HAT C-terminal dimerisation domain-containing protein n=1 Tax=Dissostichus mawsoni TaxID=36200 RepID=A0A7J5XAK7_DISMA|nr:hypothetical protein F7725_025240 [Dissostichus mawsoni]